MVGEDRVNKEFDYTAELKERLEKDVWLRHLFNKLGTVVRVKLEDVVIEGILKTIQFQRGIINIEVGSEDKTWFINWKHIHYIEVRL